MNAERSFIFVFLLVLIFAIKALPVPQASGIDPEALIERILAVEAKQRSEITDVILDAENIQGKRESDGNLTEEKRFVKKIYIKYLPDTTWYQEGYLEYYKNGELQNPEERDKEAAKQIEKERKRKTSDISYPVLSPFYPEQRGQYEITYEGVAADRIDEYVCHHFRVNSKEAESDYINGDYYFEAESFHLVKVDFSPAKLVRKTMFKLNRLNMSIRYRPTPEGWWLPRRFDVEGKGKRAFFMGIRFAATEYYSNPQINTGIQAKVFEDNND
jgi:hypothetical protein